MNEPIQPPVSPKPKYRGHLHLAGAFLALPAVIVLFQHAVGATARISAAVYGVSLVFLLATSGTYHTPMWSPKVRAWFRRVDHAAIFLLIAGTYTPICLVSLGQEDVGLLIWGVWIAAATGAIISLIWVKPPKALLAAVYVALGWAMIPYIPTMVHHMGTATSMLLFGGGAIYTLGAVTYAKRWPNPAPLTFGYHEVFHAAVLVAGASHYVAVWNMVA